ncbi:DNA glycosylase [Gautieria morchelliformis]|nr:DNA glycosylase [Gautieria morchelliformis]
MAKGSTSLGITGKRQPKTRRLSVTIDDDADTKTEVTARLHSAELHSLKNENVAQLRASLLEWFADVRDVRGMPWRRRAIATSPEEQAQRAYEVWVSEIMLQQTQVATVIPYYTRWMEKFPTIQDLAAADIDTVNCLWKGLGYYSRAARLLAGAQKVVTKFSGRLPADTRTLEKEIPGIGRYSAGAICSIAYGVCAPVLDGNVHRLLSRVLALHASPKAKKTLDLLWDAAEAMVQGSDRPGDVNQALIELGSTVCKVRDPICESCPLNDGCGAHKESRDSKDLTQSTSDIEDLCEICVPAPSGSLVTRFPMKAIKKTARAETDVVNIVEWRCKGERHFALVRRPEGGLLAGLYEFPSAENIDEDEKDILEISHSIIDNLLAAPPPRYPPSNEERAIGASDGVRLRITDIRHVGDTLHVFSHIRKTYRIFSVVLQGGSSRPLLSHDCQHRSKRRKARDVGEDDLGAHMRWVLEKDVADAITGTGVLKVWKKARLFWNSTRE